MCPPRALLFGLLVLVLGACQSFSTAGVGTGVPAPARLDRILDRGELRVGLSGNQPPLNMKNKSGEIIGLVGTFRDVTDVHLAQEELKQTLNELDARVQRRTAELERANEALRREVDDRIRLQAEERQQRTYAEALRDTAAAMRAGAYHVGRNGVLATVAALRRHYGELPVIVTGGLGGMLDQQEWPVDPDWTVRGAAGLAESIRSSG